MLAVCGGSHDNGNNSVIVSLDGSRLFVANAGNNSVSVFSVDRNGANPTPLATFALSPDGKYVVGQKAYVHFKLGKQPLVWQWYRKALQILQTKPANPLV